MMYNITANGTLESISDKYKILWKIFENPLNKLYIPYINTNTNQYYYHTYTSSNSNKFCIFDDGNPYINIPSYGNIRIKVDILEGDGKYTLYHPYFLSSNSRLKICVSDDGILIRDISKSIDVAFNSYHRIFVYTNGYLKLNVTIYSANDTMSNIWSLGKKCIIRKNESVPCISSIRIPEKKFVMDFSEYDFHLLSYLIIEYYRLNSVDFPTSDIHPSYFYNNIGHFTGKLEQWKELENIFVDTTIYDSVRIIEYNIDKYKGFICPQNVKYVISLQFTIDKDGDDFDYEVSLAYQVSKGIEHLHNDIYGNVCTTRLNTSHDNKIIFEMSESQHMHYIVYFNMYNVSNSDIYRITYSINIS